MNFGGLCRLCKPTDGRFTVPFDIVIGWVTCSFPGVVGVYCLLVILGGAFASLAVARRDHAVAAWARALRTTPPLLALRLAGAPLALLYLFRVGPDALVQPAVADLMWRTLAFSVGVIIPIGAAFLVLFVRYGMLDFVGTLMRPIMRPLFRLPGRSTLDSLTSWVGSYSVGLYLTRQLFGEGYYNRRETYTIVTCFSTVSIGFVAVVVQTLDLLHLFLVYFVAIYALTALLARTWPIKRVPEAYLGEPHPEAEEHTAVKAAVRVGLLRRALRRALDEAEERHPCRLALRTAWPTGCAGIDDPRQHPDGRDGGVAAGP